MRERIKVFSPVKQKVIRGSNIYKLRLNIELIRYFIESLSRWLTLVPLKNHEKKEKKKQRQNPTYSNGFASFCTAQKRLLEKLPVDAEQQG